MYFHEVIKSALEYIAEHYSEDLNCRAVAEKFAYSEYHFHRLFKHIASISVTDYIRDRRLFAAANKILDSDDTILDICLFCGFEHQQTFDRVFKQKYGLTPKDFRIRHEYVNEPAPDEIIRNFYYRLMQEGGNCMLKPYIVEKGVMRFVGRSATMDNIGSLYEHMNEIFERVPNPVDSKFYGIVVNDDYWLCKEVGTYWEDSEKQIRHKLGADMQTLTIPATRWLYMPTRYDDPFVKNLAPEEYRDDPGYLTPCVFGWGKMWLKENGYERQDYQFELEIYGLNDGYEEIEGGANITLAIPMV